MRSLRRKLKQLKIDCRNNILMRKHKKRIAKVKNSVLKCGANLQVFGEVNIFSPERLAIGDDCRLNQDVFINARSSVNIGNDVTISHGAKLLSTGYNVEKWMETGEREHFTDRPIYISSHCWIGAGAIILPGVNIKGEYVVIAAGAVVTKDVDESRVVLAGVPAKIVKRL